MTLRMFALIILKPVCVCIRSWAVNSANIPGPDINAMLESYGARLAVMLEKSNLFSTLTASNEGNGKEGGSGHEQSVGFTLVFSCNGSVFLAGQDKKRNMFVFVSVLFS